ncbi:MAG: hypothetical protein HQ541_17985 [Mariniphaga sp.]|nr:hypothetical protein [Mariniphaga sp.]
MRIQLDYDTKTITLVNDVSLKEFFDKIKNLLPDWKEWNVASQTTIPYYPNPVPWWDYRPSRESGTPITFEGAGNTNTDCKVVKMHQAHIILK